MTIPRELQNQRNVLRERKSTLRRTPEWASRADKAEAESKTMEKTPNRSHDPLEDLRSRGETQAKSQELENFAKRHEPKKVSGIRMHWQKQIHLLQDDVSCSQKREI